MKFDWLGLVKVIAPIVIAQTVPHGDLVAPLVVHGIESAEGLKGAPGADKLAHARDLVNTGIAGINAAAGSQKIDPAAVSAAVESGISTTVDIAKLIHKQSLVIGG